MAVRTIITHRLPLARYGADLVHYSELLIFLAARDLAVRYKQTVAGILWAILVPLLTVVALSFVFGRVAGLDGSTLLAVYAGMIPWQFFAAGLQTGGQSLINNSTLVTKLYFPRVILPLATLGVAFVDLILNLLLILGLAAFMGAPITPRLLSIPAWVGLSFLATLGPMLIVAAALVRYRDLRFLIPFIIQFGMFITPVGYSLSAVPTALHDVYMLNPLVGAIEGMRWALLGGEVFPSSAISTSLVVSSLLIILGCSMFIRAEKTMADEL